MSSWTLILDLLFLRKQMIAGLSCLEDREQAYNMAWSWLDKRFGN